MVLTLVAIATAIGITPAANCNAIIAEFLPAGLAGLVNFSKEEVSEIFTSYARRTDIPFTIHLTVNQRQRLKGLMLWAKDQSRVMQPLSFTDGTTNAQLNVMLSEATERNVLRKEQKKVGESYLDHTFNNKLKGQSQWNKFIEELESTLSMIVGSQGVTLEYVIHSNNEP